VKEGGGAKGGGWSNHRQHRAKSLVASWFNLNSDLLTPTRSREDLDSSRESRSRRGRAECHCAEERKARARQSDGHRRRLRCVEAGRLGVAGWPHPRASGCGLPLVGGWGPE